jgi:hypothetical protein
MSGTLNLNRKYDVHSAIRCLSECLTSMPYSEVRYQFEDIKKGLHVALPQNTFIGIYIFFSEIGHFAQLAT